MHLFNRKVARALIYDPIQKKVLVIKSYFSPGFSLPGGGVGKNETYEQAAIREIGEELGIKSDAIKEVLLFKKLHADTRLFFPLASEILILKIVLGREVVIKKNHEIRGLLWISDEESETLLKKYYEKPF